MEKQQRQDLGTKPVILGKATLPLGFASFVMLRQIVAVCMPKAVAAKGLRQKYRSLGRLVDITWGRRTRSMILTASNHLFLSAVSCETVRARLEELDKNGNGEEAEDLFLPGGGLSVVGVRG